MDLDGDGINDIISGSYWPGELYVFKGMSDGTYTTGEVLKDEAGKNLIASKPWPGERQPDMDSLAAVPFAYDFTGNCALDMLVGNIAGHVMLIPNNGTRDAPSYCAETRTRLKAGGEEIKVGGGDAGPIMVDWDGDGLDDLLVGAGDGSVWFYRNIGADGGIELDKGVALIDADPSSMQMREGDDNDASSEPKRPGMRVKVHATDYNGDGHLDLLVGDFTMTQKPAPELTDEQIARRDELRKAQETVNEAMSKFYEELAKDGGDIDFTALESNEEFMTLQTRSMEIWQELNQYEPGWNQHGFVWLYLRKAG